MAFVEGFFRRAAIFRLDGDFAGFRVVFAFAELRPVGVRPPRATRAAIALPSSAGERTVVTRAASSAANLSAAVPLPPEITAPA